MKISKTATVLALIAIAGAAHAADVAISALSSGTTLGGTEAIPMVQSGGTRKTTPADFSTYVIGQLTSANVISKWSGSCDFRAFMRGDGACDLQPNVNAAEVALQRYRSIANGTARKIAWVGDSTTALMFSGSVGGFGTVLGTSSDYADSTFGFPGGPYYSVTHSNFGDAGQTAANFAAGSASSGKNISDVIAATPDLVVIKYGINDVRLGVSSQATLKANLISIVTQIHAGLPNADIILQIPNSLLYDSGNSPAYIDAPVSLAKVQSYSDKIYGAYIELVGYFPHVYVLDTRSGQRKIYSRSSRDLSQAGFYMADALHPNGEAFAAEIREVALLLGDFGSNHYAKHNFKVAPLVPEMSQAAFLNASSSSATPYLIDPRVCEDKSQYNLLLDGQISSGSAGSYISIAAMNGTQSNIALVGIFANLDVIVQYGVTTTTSGPAGEKIEAGISAFGYTGLGTFEFGGNTALSTPTGYPLTQKYPNAVRVFRPRPAGQKFDYDPDPNIAIFATTFTAGTLTQLVQRFSVISTITGVAGSAPTTGGTVDLKINGTTFATLTWANSATTPTYSGTFFTAGTRGLVFAEGDVLSAVVGAGFVSGANMKISLNGK